MARLPQLQPRFSLIVHNRDKSKGTLDISRDVDSVTLEIDTDRISILTFEINNVAKKAYDEWLDSYIRIDFYGGFYTTDDYFKEIKENGKIDFDYSKGSTNEHFRYLFNGSINRLQYSYKANGTKTLTAECKDFSWGAIAKQDGHYAYPSSDCKRQFAASKTSMKFTDIIKGIAEEVGMKYHEDIDQTVVSNFEYTLTNPAVQDGITDWKFMSKLASQNACYLWSKVDENGAYTLYLVDKDKARNVEDRLEFVWLDRDENFDFIQGGHLQEGNAINDYSKLKDNQLKLEEVSVEVSPQIAGTNISQITQFDDATGEEKQVLVSYDETTEEIIYYELNKEKVRLLVRDNPAEADRISNMGAFNIPRETFLEYYTPVPYGKHDFKAIDRPMHGIEVTGKTIGNVNIEPFQSYKVYGIGKWSTRKNSKTLRYYLHGLTHTWDASGFYTEVRMKA